MALLKARLLGQFEVWRGDQLISPEEWPTQKTKTLLKVLLTKRGHVVPRDRLMELLWPDLTPRSAANSLRVGISHLRHVLEPALGRPANSTFILTHPQGYTFQVTPDCWIDVDAFQDAIAQGQAAERRVEWGPAIAAYQAAEGLYRGDYLEGDPYEDWAIGPRERLHEAYLDMLSRLAECHAQQGHCRRALAACQKLLALDPLRESVYRQVMVYHYRLGQRGQALRAFERCREVLATELGVDPMPETVDLHTRILREELAAEPVIAQPTPSPTWISRPHNLPAQLTPFIGREEELDGIAQLVRDNPSCRLLTLVGPGGIGKTRLALEAAVQQIGVFRHGVYFIPLAAVSSVEYLSSTIADALKLPLAGRQDPKLQLLDYLREKEMLLVMDRFEHLLEGAELLVDILQNAPAMRILVTSRERLHLPGEWLFEIQGLTFPEGDRSDEIESYSAVQLFLQTARRVHPSFSLSAAEKPFVIRICQLLEGIPLGIELASAWVRVLACREIAGEIEHNLDFLSTSMRSVPERHRSLRAVFDHSWNLLSEEERNVFRNMSVFRGGFGKDAAESVAGTSLRLLWALMDKSLLHRNPSGRYELHDLLRQYAEEKLREVSRLEKVQDLHCEYYAAFLHHREVDLQGERQKEVLEEIREEIENVRVAWRWAVKQGHSEEVEKSLASLYLFYQIQSRFREGVAVFGSAVKQLGGTTGLPERSEEEKDEILGKLLARQGALCRGLGLYSDARELLQKSLSLFRRLGTQKEIAFSLNHLGVVAWALGEYTAAEQLLQESLAICSEIGDERGIANTYNNLGIVADLQGEYAQAKQLYQESLAIRKEIGDRWGMANTLNNLGVNAAAIGEYAEAKQRYQESIAIRREIGDQRGIANPLTNLGVVAHKLGEYAEAIQLYQESLAIFREIGDRLGIANTFTNLGVVAEAQGEYVEARRWHQQSLAIYKEIADRKGIAVSLNNLGNIAYWQGEYAEAKQHLQESLIIRRELGDRWGIVYAFNGLGDVACALGEHQESHKHFLEALQTATEIGAVALAAEALVGIATLLKEQGETDQALELAAVTLHHPATFREVKDRAERLLSELEAQFSPQVIATARERAKATKLEEVVEETLAKRDKT